MHMNAYECIYYINFERGVENLFIMLQELPQWAMIWNKMILGEDDSMNTIQGKKRNRSSREVQNSISILHTTTCSNKKTKNQ